MMRPRANLIDDAIVSGKFDSKNPDARGDHLPDPELSHRVQGAEAVDDGITAAGSTTSPVRNVPGGLSNDPNQTSIFTRKRDTLRSRWVSNRTGEAGTVERKSILRPVTGAITCAAAEKLARRAFSKAATRPCSSSAGPMVGNGGEWRKRVAKPHELPAARSSRREEALRW